jgi:hypothetical protein
MNALVVGGAVAAVMAGPPLYGMVQTGELDGTSAIGRGLLVAGACAAGAAYVLKLLRQFEQEGDRKAKREKLLIAIAEADEAAKRQAAAVAAAAAATEKNQRHPS